MAVHCLFILLMTVLLSNKCSTKTLNYIKNPISSNVNNQMTTTSGRFPDLIPSFLRTMVTMDRSNLQADDV